MNLIIAILLLFFAGIINGSLALPTKYIPKWKFENIWLNYAIWCYVILPWTVMVYLIPQILQIYNKIPSDILSIIIIGGFFYGLGQIGFALAISMIGMGLGFVISLGVGIVIGYALPFIIQHSQKILTQFGIITIIGILLAVIGLIISNYAGMLRDRHKNKIKISQQIPSTKGHILGIILAIISGLSTAILNFIFSYTHSVQVLALQAGASNFAATNIIWPVFLLCGSVPYIIYMIYLHYKNHSFGAYYQKNISKYYLFTIIMAIASFAPILLYCKASQLIGALGPILGWPIFMILVILSSSFWGWKHQEWKDCGKYAENTIKIGLGFLIISVVILGYSSALA